MPLVQALAGDDVEGGSFWGPRRVVTGEPRAARPSRITRVAEIAERLWAEAEDATGVRWPFARAADVRR